MNKRFLTVKQFSEMFGVSVDSVYKARKRGSLPFIHDIDGVGLRADMKGLDAWCEAQTEAEKTTADVARKSGEFQHQQEEILQGLMARAVTNAAKGLMLAKGEGLAANPAAALALVEQAEGEQPVLSVLRGKLSDDVQARLLDEVGGLSGSWSWVGFIGQDGEILAQTACPKE